LASNAIINSFQAQIFITPKSFNASLDFNKGVGLIEMVFFYEVGCEIYI